MSAKEILLADSDNDARKHLAARFGAAGYDVEATDSTAHLFDTVLAKQMPVVLLGSGCNRNITMANLVPLLKKCNKGVTIILISDEASLPAMRAVRREGIFYHALKPADTADTEEVLKAVECAFDKTGKARNERTSSAAAQQEASFPATAPGVPSEEELPATIEAIHYALPPTEKASATPSSKICGEPKNLKNSIRARAAIIVGMTVSIACFVSYMFASATRVQGNGDLMIWAFLGFCSLIAVGQLLPALMSVRATRKFLARRLRGNLAANGEKRHACTAFDKN